MRKSRILEYSITVLLAFLPSLYLLLRYPPFFNGIDASCYFNYPSPIPHYPLFYPLYCLTFLKLLGDGIGIIYGIILIQHIFYSLAVVYISLYFNNFSRRLIFLAGMLFAFMSSTRIHGLYTESWAIILTGFMLGAVMFICGDKKKKITLHYSIYAISVVLLLLTRFAGIFLIFIQPLYTLLDSLYYKRLLTRTTLRLLASQLLFLFGLAITAQLITFAFLEYHQAQDFSVYGRPGTCRIYDALDPKCTFKNPTEVLAVYKAATNDTLVKLTFDIIRSPNSDLWLGAYNQVDSLRKEFIARGLIKGGKSADAYLNAAYKIYFYKPLYYPYKIMLTDCWNYFSKDDGYDGIMGDSKLFLHTAQASLPASLPLLKQYIAGKINESDYEQVGKDYLLKVNGRFFMSPVLIIFSLVFFCFIPIPVKLRLLFTAAVISATCSYLLTTIITMCILRYAQPAMFMIYAMFFVLVASLKSDKYEQYYI